LKKRGLEKEKTGRERPVSENALDEFDYFNEVLIEVKFVLNADPTPFTATMMATAIPAAIRPYSMAVAAESSRQNIESIAFMASRLACRLHTGTKGDLRSMAGP
jgi:hypothetical protein